MKLQKICYMKTGWASDYQGSSVFGSHKYLEENRDGGEKFNFLPGPDGYFYPMFPSAPPALPSEMDGWTVIVVSRDPQDKPPRPVRVVGWFMSSSFFPRMRRPEYDTEKGFEMRQGPDPEYSYDLRAKHGFLVPLQDRSIILPSECWRRLEQAPKVIVRGPGADGKEWRNTLARFAETVVENYALDASCAAESGGSISLGTAEHRKRVEMRAEALATEFYQESYEVERVADQNLGYDFLLIHRQTRKEIHLEVKGTASRQRRFFISRNERRYAQRFQTEFRLFLATNVLSDTGEAEVSEYSYEEMLEFFAFSAPSYYAVEKGALDVSSRT